MGWPANAWTATIRAHTTTMPTPSPTARRTPTFAQIRMATATMTAPSENHQRPTAMAGMVRARSSTYFQPTETASSGLPDGRYVPNSSSAALIGPPAPVSYTHLRAHETRHDL